MCRNNILLGELQFFSLQSIAPRLHSVYILLDYRQSTCTQATCSLHPLESTTQPTHKNLSSWRYCIFYKKKPEQHSAQTRTRILPAEVLMLQASNGTVRVLNYKHSSIATMLQHSSLYIQRKGDVVISTISMNNLTDWTCFLDKHSLSCEVMCDRITSLSASIV